MFKKITGTFFTKLAAAVINFLIIIITTNCLGAEARGEISIIVVGITITVLINEIVGGSALIYLIPKESIFTLLIISYLWAILICSVISVILPVLGVFPREYTFCVFLISLLQCFNAIHLLILLGKEKIKLYNIFYVLQFFILIVLLVWFFLVKKEKSIDLFLLTMGSSYIIPLFLGVIYSYKEVKSFTINFTSSFIKKLFTNGINAQLATLAHLLSTRLCFYFLVGAYVHEYLGKKAVGIFATALSVAEASLLITGSAAVVIYSKVANSSNPKYSTDITIKLAKLCMFFTTIVLLVMVTLPANFYALVFGNDFIEVKKIIVLLTPGIMVQSFTVIYTYYFSGLGKYRINMYASFIQLIITITAGFVLIQQYKLTGAGIVISISYLSSSVFTFLIFKKISSENVKELFPALTDFKDFKTYLYSIIK